MFQYADRISPMDKHVATMAEAFDISAAPMMPQMFGNAGIEHMKKYIRAASTDGQIFLILS